MPGYIEADRTEAEQTLGGTLANDVFSDRFTALRKRLIASSLRDNPAAGCGDPPAFTLQTVAGGQRLPDVSAWMERYVIKVPVRGVRRRRAEQRSAKAKLIGQRGAGACRSMNGTRVRMKFAHPRPK
jgi:hypothetical protein